MHEKVLLYIYSQNTILMGTFMWIIKKNKSCTFAFAWQCGATALPNPAPKKGHLLTHRGNAAYPNVQSHNSLPVNATALPLGAASVPNFFPCRI